PWCYYPSASNITYSYEAYKNALIFTLTYTGIPIIYYGTEQAFHGCNDPNNREVLWTTNYNQNTILYKFLQTVITYRKKLQIWNGTFNVRMSANNIYCYTRGNNFLVCLTNVGTNGNAQTATFNPYLLSGTYCNIFDYSDCFDASNSITIVLIGGSPKIYIPKSSL